MAEAEQLPYGTFGMFDGCIERFKEAVVPTTLNRHVLSDLSGADYSALSTGLRFFRLMDSERHPKPAFRELVEAKKKGPDAYRVALRKLIDDHYSPTIKSVDVERGTLPDLEKAFKDSGAKQGQMLTKAIRFYIKALEEGCGVKVSEHITKQRRTPRSRTKTNGKPAGNKTPSKNNGGAATGETPLPTPGADPIPDGFRRLPIPGIEGGYIQYPANLTAAQCKLLDGAVMLLKTYVEVNSSAEDTNR